MTSKLTEKKCVPCEGGAKPLDAPRVAELMQQLTPRWKTVTGGEAILGEFEFKNYYRTVAFVNAVAWIAHTEDHHPDVIFGYRKVTVRYWTHNIGGLSENDFICAAKVDALLPE
ncbi:MAG TPA: 4a-hydroxytetrahydrobiopterin dehydratase [Candidatus Binatia bacterium]|nr:4a-hydroxytetrahydrobiopterin dehydratase [Candidatus Binatia bacterium]